MNEVILMGRLTRDPELRVSQSGLNVCYFSIAVRSPKKENNNDVDFINVVAFDKKAEFVMRYFKKGQNMLLRGRIKPRKDKENKTYLSIVAEDMYFTEKKEQAQHNDEFVTTIPDDVEFPF